MSKMLNGLLLVASSAQQNAISTNFHGAAILFNRKLFKLEFRHEDKKIKPKKLRGKEKRNEP
jgi:hypothetical protein